MQRALLCCRAGLGVSAALMTFGLGWFPPAVCTWPFRSSMERQTSWGPLKCSLHLRPRADPAAGLGPGETEPTQGPALRPFLSSARGQTSAAVPCSHYCCRGLAVSSPVFFQLLPHPPAGSPAARGLRPGSATSRCGLSLPSDQSAHRMGPSRETCGVRACWRVQEGNVAPYFSFFI